MPCCSKKTATWWSSGVGLILIITGLILTISLPGVIENIVLKQDVLGTTDEEGTKVPNAMTNQWANPPYDMRQHIWMYNVTNVAAIMNGAKPRVSEIGPFVFIEKQNKVYNFTDDESRVFYRNNHLFFYNRSLSCDNCDLNQLVTIPNPVFQKLVDVASQGFAQRLAIEAVLATVKKEFVFITVTVREALFDGFKDPLLDKICNVPLLSYLCKNSVIPDRIGFFYKQNNTDDGLYEVSTGLNNPMTIGKVFTFNNQTAIPNVWDVPAAGYVNGTDGQLFPPLIKKGDSFTIFAGPICRKIVMQYVDESEHKGIPAFRFEIPSSIYDTTLSENKMYCNRNGTPQFFEEFVQPHGCLPPGFIDVGRCMPGGARIYLSQGHFLGAPSEVWSAIEGIELPNSQYDKTVVDIEKTSGVPIRAKRVMQVNLGMIKGNLDVLKNTKNVIMPILWMNETADFDEGTRAQLSQLTFALHASFIFGVSVVCVGGIVLIALAAAVLIHSVSREQSEDREPIVGPDAGQSEQVEE